MMEMELPIVPRRSIRRRYVFIVVILVVLFSVAAFLIGYFAMKAEKDTAICRTANGAPGKEKYHEMFQGEIQAKNIEENLRLVRLEICFREGHFLYSEKNA